MVYNNIIETVDAILESETIHMENLSLEYSLGYKNFIDLQEEIFHLFNPMSVEFIPENEFEIEYKGFIVKFKNKDLEE